jgi:ABC-type glycerol-3-phosphate transport system substrate-binding protein
MSKTTISRRSFLRAAAVTAASASIAACTPASQVTPAAQTGGQQPAGPQNVTLSMWTHDNLYVQFFNDRGNEWKEKYADQYNISFDFQQVPEVFTKMLAALSANEPVPDLFGLEQGHFGNYTKNNLIDQKFVDISNYIAPERNKFVENTWAKYTYQGKTYGVESALCTVGFYYQPAVLEKFGRSELPATWEDFMNLGMEAAQQGVFLSALDAEGSGVFDMLFLQRGGEFFDKDANFVLNKSPNREIFLEVLAYLKNGVDNGVFWPASGGDFWGAGLMAAHGEGRVMGLPAADWWSDSLLKNNAADQSGNWRIGMMPKWQSGGHASSVWGGTGFVITKASAHVDLTWDLLHYGYMTKENQLKRYEQIRYLPHMFEALDDPRFTEATDPFYGGQKVGQVWTEAAKDMPLYYQSPVRGDLNTEKGAQVTNVYAGNTTPEAALEAIVRAVEIAIEDL